MMLIPLKFLILVLSVWTHVPAPANLPQALLDQNVRVVETMPGNLAGYNCGGQHGAGSTLCPTGSDVEITLLGLWDRPEAMQHLLMHELGHTLFPQGGEEAAERYACQTVPMNAQMYNFRCYPSGRFEVNIR